MSEPKSLEKLVGFGWASFLCVQSSFILKTFPGGPRDPGQAGTTKKIPCDIFFYMSEPKSVEKLVGFGWASFL